jgi:hypothetical protein
MNFKEAYKQFHEISNSKELRELHNKVKNNTLTESEGVRLDELVTLSYLKINSEDEINEKLFKKKNVFKLNNGDVLEITRGTTQNDSKVCFKLNNKTESYKKEFEYLLLEMYGLKYNGDKENTELTSDDFKKKCDELTNNIKRNGKN